MRVSPTPGQLIYIYISHRTDRQTKTTTKTSGQLVLFTRLEARTPRVQIRMTNTNRNVRKSGHYSVPVVMTMFAT